MDFSVYRMMKSYPSIRAAERTDMKPAVAAGIKENKTAKRLPYSPDEHYFLRFFFLPLDFVSIRRSLMEICNSFRTKPHANTKIVKDKIKQVGVWKS